jgi:hypothetical protein
MKQIYSKGFAGAVFKQRVQYKLNMDDVDVDSPTDFILNLPRGFRFNDEVVHVRGFSSMRELREAVKNEVIECRCSGCTTAATPKGTP